MHSYVRYSGPDAKRKARLDFVEWCGFRRSVILFRWARGCSEENFHHWCSFVGVEGYPVTAVYRRYGRDRD